MVIRNTDKVGAAKFEVENEGYRHWFDGLAMLYGFNFRSGSVYFSNKFIKGKTYLQSKEKGRIVYQEFATRPGTAWSHRVALNIAHQFTDNTSVNIMKTGNHFIAMTETPQRLEFDPSSLETIGPYKYKDNILGHITTAHPHYDFEKDEYINYITSFLSLGSSYHIYRIKMVQIKGKL
ncbi:hypothetical protein N752_02050 [Desulforamulus aquiferis]|nr:carotenoid oxygenase family protein [Desulforamulus aquiferis]RYD06936.1 hypothetical protein N752_02050 [Desulforamulus aquiferis]